MDVIFNDSEYRWEYGHPPRGRGYWWFFFEDMEFSYRGTYTEARAACRRYIKSVAPHGYKEIVEVRVGT